MRRTSFAIAATACSSLLALGLVAAPAASAYPPGKEQKTLVSKDIVRAESKLKPEVRNAQPGCRATFAVVNANGKVVTSRTTSKANGVNSQGRAARTLRMPKKAGAYEITVTVSGKGCTQVTSSVGILIR